MLTIVEEELAGRQLVKAHAEYPRFETYWDHVTYWLALDTSIGETDGKRINDTNPPIYAVDMSAWRSGGIPPVSLAYEQTETRITILRVAIHVPKARKA